MFDLNRQQRGLRVCAELLRRGESKGDIILQDEAANESECRTWIPIVKLKNSAHVRSLVMVGERLSLSLRWLGNRWTSSWLKLSVSPAGFGVEEELGSGLLTSTASFGVEHGVVDLQSESKYFTAFRHRDTPLLSSLRREGLCLLGFAFALFFPFVVVRAWIHNV